MTTAATALKRRPLDVFLAGVVVIPLLTFVGVLVVPKALTAPSSAAWLPVAVAVLTILYLTLGVRLRRRPSPVDPASVIAGVLAGICWSAEIYVGGPARVSYSTEQALGGTFVALATIVTVAAAPVITRLHPGAPDRFRAGMLTGLVSGAFVFIFAVSMTLLTVDTLAQRNDYRHQFLTSGAATIHAFLVQDILVGACAHLIINLLLGLTGTAIAIVFRRARTGQRFRRHSQPA